MAELINPLSKSPSSSLPTSFSLKNGYPSLSNISSHKSSLSLPTKFRHSNLFILPRNCAVVFLPKSSLGHRSNLKHSRKSKLQEVHSTEEFDAALLLAKDNLVLVEYVASRCRHGGKTRPLSAVLSRRLDGVCFVVVKADESEKTKRLCKRERVEKVPTYRFHKNKKRIHEKPRLTPEEFTAYALYYGNSHESVIQLHCKEELENLMEDHKADSDKLLVLNVGLSKDCEPCVRIYPTMVKLSTQMTGYVVFARMLIGDDDNGCFVEFLRSKNVDRVPAFLFTKGGEIRGSYVGSVKPKLVRKVAEYREQRWTS